MQRRQIIRALALGGTLAGAGGAYLWLSAERDHPSLTIANTLQKLERMASGTIEKSGAWNPFQVFNHCAQSIEYSMSGFPQSESPLFQATAGRLAFAVFSAQGSMSHSLDEVIPGAPKLTADGDVLRALDRLLTALRTFDNYQGDLQPHFAFGPLTKPDYELAHVLHIENHLQEFVASGDEVH